MKRTLYLITCFIVLLASCRREKTDDKKLVYERLHGKYRAMSSVSEQAVDVNLDGVVHTDLLLEMPDLLTSNLEIRITDHFLICQFWPEQYLSPGNGPVAVNYANQGVGRMFLLSEDILQVQQSPNEQDLVKWPMPELVTVDETGLVTVVIVKRMYTSGGWVNVRTRTVYKRYTMKT